MQKTKLGITVGLLGAAVYFLGLISILPFILLAGYILLVEENEWLRKSAVKAMIIIVVYNLVYAVFGLGDNIYNTINYLLSSVDIHANLGYPFYINSIVFNVADFIKTILLILLGFKALSQGSVKISAIDKVIDKNM